MRKGRTDARGAWSLVSDEVEALNPPDQRVSGSRLSVLPTYWIGSLIRWTSPVGWVVLYHDDGRRVGPGHDGYRNAVRWQSLCVVHDRETEFRQFLGQHDERGREVDELLGIF